mgnify:CR=1 FL=1
MLHRRQSCIRRELPRCTELQPQARIRQQNSRCFLPDARDTVQQLPPSFHIRVVIRQVFYLFFDTCQLRAQTSQQDVNAGQLNLRRGFPPVFLLRLHLCQRLMP